tara:strand:- start:6014 stop:8422 length:2409 start_codon:yes stop_codon:yes gene_type:complete
VPKLIKNINNFSGGLNNNTNRRDIIDSESQVLLNVSNEIPGKLVMEGRSVASNLSSNDVTAIDALNYGNGLLHTNLDRNFGAAGINETEYLFINDKTDSIVRIYDVTNGAAEATTIDYGNTASLVEMYSVDGQIRVVPHYGNAGNTPQVLGYYNFDRNFGYTTSTSPINNSRSNIYISSDLHIAPIKGGTNSNVAYETDKLYNKMTHFHPDNDSEIFMLNVGSADYAMGVDGGTNTTQHQNKVEVTAQEMHDLLDGYLDNASGYTSDGKGSMAVIAYFRNDVNADDDTTIKPKSGKRYGLWASKVYSNYDDDTNKSESVAVYLGSVYQHVSVGTSSTDVAQKLYFGLTGRMGDKDPRYSGFKIYYALMDGFTEGSTIDNSTNIGVKYLLAEVDFGKGLRYAGSNTYQNLFPYTLIDDKQWTWPVQGWMSTDRFIGDGITDLSIAEPYIIEGPSVIGEANTGFKTSTILNRRIYAGNVQYYDSERKLVTKSDRVLKSLPNQFDYFPENSFIDVEVEDGDTIIKLESLGNKLLQFKRNKLFIINVSRDIEFLEAEYEHKGCEKDYHVVKGEGFVAWFNTYGAYIYDGQQVIDINLSQVAQPKLADWSTTHYHDNNVIGYLPKSKELIIVNKNQNILFYDLKSESWRQSNVFGNTDITNLVNFNNGDLYWWSSVAGLMGNPDTIDLVKWDKTPSSKNGGQVLYKSKEFDMGSAATNKNYNSLYINYKEGANVKVQAFGTKTDASEIALTDVGTLSSGGFKTTKMAFPATFKNCVGVGIALTTTNATNANFEVNDIQIIYREKVTR